MFCSLFFSLCLCVSSAAGGEKNGDVCGQVKPLLALFAARGQAIPGVAHEGLLRAAASGDARRVDRMLSAYALLEIHINPESRVKVTRGTAPADLARGRETLFLIRVVNEGGVTAPLTLSGSNLASSVGDATGFRRARWLAARLVSPSKPGAPAILGGSPLEYVALSLNTLETGRREAVLAFDVGQGTQDLGFRGECAVLFRCGPAKPR